MLQVCVKSFAKSYYNLLAQATIGVMYKTGEGVKEQSIEKVRSTLG